MKFALIFALLFSAPAFSDADETATPAKGAASPELSETIAQKDAKMFEAFNKHDADALMSMFTDDLEFYQDNDGLKKHSECMEDFKKLFVNNPGIKRELVKGSLEVYPIKDYGAIEIGLHRFCHTENGKEECGDFKFVHVWRKDADVWKVARVISYGH
jgi:ketosteroid isomerase-like protein